MNAAHIHSFNGGRYNDPRNSLALCENAHWQFDRSLWSITDDYRVIISRDKFSEEGVPGQKLAHVDGHWLFLPSEPVLAGSNALGLAPDAQAPISR